MKVFVVIGTRPEAIKLAPVVTALRDHAEVVICTTGQHPRMAAAALQEFGLQPDLVLAPAPDGRALVQLTTSMLENIDPAIGAARPDWVMVQGDTTSAFVGGLAGFYRHVPIAHVEAGLRTANLTAPFPEEANRAMLARIATLNFASTARARTNLLAEGITPETVVLVGNTVVDAVRQARAGATPTSDKALAAAIGLDDRQLVLVTCHRRENQGAVLPGIAAALAQLAARYSSYQWLLPMHPNPELRAAIGGALKHLPNVLLREPLGYRETLLVLSRAVLVVTDLGGIQEEAPAFGTPVVVLRDVTERQEGIDAGFASLAGRAPAGIVAAVSNWLDAPERRLSLAQKPNPYGDGHAARRIAERLLATGAA